MIVNTYTSFKFPFQFGAKGTPDEGRVCTVGGVATRLPSFPEIELSVQTGIRQLILTGQGERVMNSNFGVGAATYVFAPLNNHTKGLLSSVIQDQIELWERRVQLSSINSTLSIDNSSIRYDMLLNLTEFEGQTASSFTIGL